MTSSDRCGATVAHNDSIKGSRFGHYRDCRGQWHGYGRLRSCVAQESNMYGVLHDVPQYQYRISHVYSTRTIYIPMWYFPTYSLRTRLLVADTFVTVVLVFSSTQPCVLGRFCHAHRGHIYCGEKRSYIDIILGRFLEKAHRGVSRNEANLQRSSVV